MDLKEEVRSRRHQLFLEALRHREQEVFGYLVIIGPALGGFGWLLDRYSGHYMDVVLFNIYTLGLVGLLLLGACYCAALGYSYRSVTFQIWKEEKQIGIADTVLRAWQGETDQWLDWTKFGHYYSIPRKCRWIYDRPWCFPPGLIAVFWYAFVIGQGLLTVTASVMSESASIKWVALALNFVCVCAAFVVPWRLGVKLRKLCEKEHANMETPDLSRVYETFVQIPAGTPEAYLQFLRRTIRPLIRELEDKQLLSWYSFLLHDKNNVPTDKPGYFVHLRLELKQGRQYAELADALPSFCTMTRPANLAGSPVDGRISAQWLRGGHVEEGWRVLGEACEWIVRMFDAYEEDVEIPMEHVGQFLHYFANALQCRVS